MSIIIPLLYMDLICQTTLDSGAWMINYILYELNGMTYPRTYPS